ncbi:uncharacterized protein LOC129600906 [Paramacrobiotus metropolitanus]|uniref:uncharacterized protein LOC129600906 n=1 Tax=Paramacrobiotus metropolitanus TaxID=2943436 RepID=UPI002446166D|nr:uncharacterized protein LOC129600906 [Paramacrobiotus metropolitanus]
MPAFLATYGGLIGGSFIGIAVIALFAVLAKLYFAQQNLGTSLNSISGPNGGAELTNARTEAANAQAALDRLRASLGATEQNNRLLNDQIDASQSQLSGLNDERKNLEDQLAEAGKDKKKKKKGKTKGKSERRKKLEADLEVARSKLATNMQLLEQMESQQDLTLQMAKSSLERVQLQDGGAKAETEQLKKDIAALNVTIQELVEETRKKSVETPGAAGDAGINAIEEEVDEESDDDGCCSCCSCCKKKGAKTSTAGKSGHTKRGSKLTGVNAHATAKVEAVPPPADGTALPAAGDAPPPVIEVTPPA